MISSIDNDSGYGTKYGSFLQSQLDRLTIMWWYYDFDRRAGMTSISSHNDKMLNVQQKSTMNDLPIAARTRMRNKRNKDADLIQCPLCTKTYFKMNSLYQHVKNVHDAQLLNTGDRTNITLKRLSLNETKIKHVCPICSRKFINLHNLRIHGMKIHNVGKIVLEKFVLTKQERETLVCNICHTCFQSQTAMKRHRLKCLTTSMDKKKKKKTVKKKISNMAVTVGKPTRFGILPVSHPNVQKPPPSSSSSSPHTPVKVKWDTSKCMSFTNQTPTDIDVASQFYPLNLFLNIDESLPSKTLKQLIQITKKYKTISRDTMSPTHKNQILFDAPRPLGKNETVSVRNISRPGHKNQTFNYPAVVFARECKENIKGYKEYMFDFHTKCGRKAAYSILYFMGDIDMGQLLQMIDAEDGAENSTAAAKICMDATLKSLSTANHT